MLEYPIYGETVGSVYDLIKLSAASMTSSGISD